MERYSLKEGLLYWGPRLLGPSTRIYVDTHQVIVLGPQDDAAKVLLPIGDYVFVTAEGKVVVVEEKKPSDLLSSWWKRRLQRQLRHTLQAGDIAVLGLRHNMPFLTGYNFAEDYSAIGLDLVRWQALGGYIAQLPAQGERIYSTLCELRAVLRPTRSLLGVVEGDDRRAIRRKSDLLGVAQALHMLFKGVGPILAERWATASENSLETALHMPVRQLATLGIHRNILKQMQELGLPLQEGK